MVRSKTDTAQKNEVLCKFVCQNVCRLIHPMYELGISPPGWNRTAQDTPTLLTFPGVA